MVNLLIPALIVSMALEQNVTYKINNPVDQIVLECDLGVYAPQYENRWGVELNEQQVETLARLVYLEAGNQDDVGQQLVTVVVFNRIIDGRFGKELEGVLSAPGQFSTWSRLHQAKPTVREYDNVLRVLHGDVDGAVYNANYLYFNSTGNGIKIGGHYFR